MSKYKTFLTLLAGILLYPVLVYAQDIGDIKEAVDLLWEGRWVAGATLGLTFILSMFKNPKLGSMFDRIPSRFKRFVPLILGCLIGLGDRYLLNHSWKDAIVYIITTGPGAILLHEIVGHGVFGVKHRKVKLKSPPKLVITPLKTIVKKRKKKRK